jgi:hypothetical protein
MLVGSHLTPTPGIDRGKVPVPQRPLSQHDSLREGGRGVRQIPPGTIIPQGYL